MPNQLINETSPYLLQHAHNPVNWFPWGNEALEKAKLEDKPILVSIGYSACHWCHVMEKESFEDEAVAAIMNRYFINIKIDREERPDLDHIYMDAVQAMTGSGGWPLNVFLTPETKPFFGGTYFPPVKAHNRSSWTEVLNGVHQAYQHKKEDIKHQAENLLSHLQQSSAFGLNTTKKAAILSADDLYIIYKQIMQQADTADGGFGKAPKFPQFAVIQYLLLYYHQTKEPASLKQACLSIDKMLEGGIYDQIGGGMSRYATDNEWLVPHFEKMLYDNALLVGTLSDAYLITKHKRYLQAIHQTLSFIENEMTSEEGGFYSALDADSEGIEGKFYVWTIDEINALLGDGAAVFNLFFDVSPQGNWEGKNILNIKESIESYAVKINRNAEDLNQLFLEQSKILLAHRNKRIRPLLDDKIILGWNSMMNWAYSRAFVATGLPHYRQIAVRNMKFLLNTFQVGADGACFHTYKNGIAKYPAFLDDYAYLIQALIALQEITGEGEYLHISRKILNYVMKAFGEEESGYFFYTHKDQEDVIVRKKEVYDGAMPSGNAIMAYNLRYLGNVFHDLSLIDRSQKMELGLLSAITKYPVSFGAWACGLYSILYETAQIVLMGSEIENLRNEILHIFIPYKTFQSSTHDNNDFPLIAGKTVGKEPFIYLCRNYTCASPVNSVALLINQLEK